MRRGFTIVELVITITIMGILLTLAVVNLISTQVGARDAERKSDIESIQLILEDYYRNNNPGSLGNVYPPTAIGSASIETIRPYLPDVDEKILIAPTRATTQESFIAAASGSALDNSFLVNDGGSFREPEINEYVYQPLDKDGGLCTVATIGGCRKFNLFYRTEADNILHMVTSKKQ